MVFAPISGVVPRRRRMRLSWCNDFFALREPVDPFVGDGRDFVCDMRGIFIGNYIRRIFFFPPNSTRDFSLRAASVLAIALLMEMAPDLIERTNLEVLSGKWIARRARSEVPDLEKLRTFGYRRDYRYALNFYLHREVPDWTEAPISDGYVLSKFASCDKLKTLDHCEDLGGT